MAPSPFYDILTQYGAPAPGVPTPILNSAKLVATTVDKTPFPGGRGSVAAPLTDLDIRAEVASVRLAHGWPNGVDSLFVVFLPRNVFDCLDATHCFLSGPNPICAYHSWFGTAANPTVYASIPDMWTQNPPFSCIPPGYLSPNHDTGADRTVDALSHEMSESVTDPLLHAWRDALGNEIGDKCNPFPAPSVYGPPLPQGGDVMFGKYRFEIQEEWSNAAGGPNGGGCVISYP